MPDYDSNRRQQREYLRSRLRVRLAELDNRKTHSITDVTIEDNTPAPEAPAATENTK